MWSVGQMWLDDEFDDCTFVRPNGTSEGKYLGWVRGNDFHRIPNASNHHAEEDSDDDFETAMRMGESVYSGSWYTDYQRWAQDDEATNRFEQQDVASIASFWDWQHRGLNSSEFIFQWAMVPGRRHAQTLGRMIADGGLNIQRLVHEEFSRRLERVYTFVLMWRSVHSKTMHLLHRDQILHILSFVQAPLCTEIVVERSCNIRPYPFVRLRNATIDAYRHEHVTWENLATRQSNQLARSAIEGDHIKVRKLLFHGANPTLLSQVYFRGWLVEEKAIDSFTAVEEGARASSCRIDECLTGVASGSRKLLFERQKFRLISLLLSTAAPFWQSLGKDRKNRKPIHPLDLSALKAAMAKIPQTPQIVPTDEIGALNKALATMKGRVRQQSSSKHGRPVKQIASRRCDTVAVGKPAFQQDSLKEASIHKTSPMPDVVSGNASNVRNAPSIATASKRPRIGPDEVARRVASLVRAAQSGPDDGVA